MNLFFSLAVALVVLAQVLTSAHAFQLWKKKDSSEVSKHDTHPHSIRDYYEHLFSNDFGGLWDPFEIAPFHHRHRGLTPFDYFWSDFDRSLWKDMSTHSDDLMKSYSPLLNTDLAESENDFHMQIDLPGIDVKDLEISIEDTHSHNKLLKIKAERKQVTEESPEVEAKTCEKKETPTGEATEECSKEAAAPKKKWIRQERLFGKIERQFQLPVNADINNAKTKYSNGVLSISVPKLPQVAGNSRRTLSIDTN